MPCDTATVQAPSDPSAYVDSVSASTPGPRELSLTFNVVNDGNVGVDASVRVDISNASNDNQIVQSNEGVSISSPGNSKQVTVDFQFSETNVPNEMTVSACADVVSVSEI